tara:strand:+ start:291 stop:1634 length:1344 start_codon:yes stop_codon:yes gene_type:complete
MSGSTYLTSNFTGTGSSTGDKVTYSVWIKRTDPAGDTRSTIISGYDDGNNYMKIRFADDDKFHIYGAHSGSANFNVYAVKECRDISGWYHLVFQIDTTHATESERVKVWINGESISISGQMPSQNHPIYTLKSDDMEIGRNAHSDNEHFDGYMSHFHCCHGYLYAPTIFGGTDSTTGEWEINSAPSVSYGSKGWFIFKDNASVTDQSGNGNSFTAGGAGLTKSEDCPSNVFAVCNPLTNPNSSLDFTQGNNTMVNSTQWLGSLSTLAMFKGKFYWEFKCTGNFLTGVSQLNTNATQSDNLGSANNGYSSKWPGGYEMINGGNKSNNNNSGTSYGSSYSSSDIGMVAFDADVGAIWFGKNGTWQASATQTEIENGTTTNAAWTGLTNASGYVASFSTENSTMNLNFGNGYFGTTAVSSAGNNASGFGIFEYDVPAGFTALCTKGINSF